MQTLNTETPLPGHLKAEEMGDEALLVPPRNRRRWLPLVTLFLIGGVMAAIARSSMLGNSTSGPANHDRVVLTIPQAGFTPEQVVHAQVISMQAAVNDADALVTCYSLASPANRLMTGPFERFSRLVSAEPYHQLATCEDWQVGSAVVKGRSATVVVSLLTREGQMYAFQFLLGKQIDEPYRDCWMTEGVYPLQRIDPKPAASDTKPRISQSPPELSETDSETKSEPQPSVSEGQSPVRVPEISPSSEAEQP